MAQTNRPLFRQGRHHGSILKEAWTRVRCDKKLSWPLESAFIRHAHSEAQKARDHGVPYPHGSDPELSELGRQQARALGLSWAGTDKPDAIIASPLRRAYQAALISRREAGWCNVPVITWPLLVEQRHGIFTNLSESEIDERYPDLGQTMRQQGYWFFRAPGGIGWDKRTWAEGENWQDVSLRMLKASEKIRRQYAGKKIKVFGHTCIIQCLRLVMERMAPEEVLEIDLGLVTNCSQTVYRAARKNKRPSLTSLYEQPPAVRACRA